MQVLIAEDERKTREILAGYLLDAGYEPLIASRGLDAVKIAGDLRPPVILIDGMLPELHGFEMSRIVREMPDYDPWIILMTAVYKASRYQREAKLRYGVDRYLIKPIAQATLIEEIGAAGRDASRLARVRPRAAMAPAGMMGTSR